MSLAQPPGTAGGAGPGTGVSGTARFSWRGLQSATVVVDTSLPAVVVVRNIFDTNWRARVDGRPATLLRADYVLQGVAVGPGHHVISLVYDDPTIGYGLAGSAAILGLILVAAVALGRRNRGSVLVPQPVA